MTGRIKLVAGNWKMNGVRTSLAEVSAIAAGAPDLDAGVELAVCPPALIASAAAGLLQNSPVSLGGQDCHSAISGAHTGDISAEMWADAGARFIIVGHSERRGDHGETDQIVASKASAAIRAGLTPIICLGESLRQRQAGETLAVVASQLAGSVPDAAATADIVVAYEPIWAIGTGLTPTLAQVEEVHTALRAGLRTRFGDRADTMRLLYGGSVKPENAPELLNVRDVDGALVGGASLKAVDFLAIARAAA